MQLPENHPLQKRFGADTGAYREFSDPMSADAAMDRMYRPWADSLSDNEKDAIRGYQQQTFDQINGTLRGHRPEDEKTPYYNEQTKLIDDALASSRVPYNMTAYRGMVDPGLSPGDVFEDKGFVSTSMSHSIAAARASQAENGIVARIRVPQGTTGAYVETVTPIDQAELLLNRGTRYRVIGKSDDGMLDLEVID